MLHGVADQIARDYLERVRIKPDFVSAACPFHKGGKERRPSFWIDRTTGRWGCFTCTEGGGDLRWLLRKLGVSNLRIEAELEDAAKDSEKSLKIERAKQKKKAKAEFRGVHTLPESLLGVYDWAPVRLLEAGFTEEVLMAHDIGFDRERDRITFPIRDISGALVGISGRATLIGEEPKYLVYSGPTRYDNGHVHMGELGEWYPEYSNEGMKDHLWRGNLVYPRIYGHRNSQVIIVEGYKAALWMVQNGWENTVALMGAKLSPVQERIVRRMGAETFVLLDNNQPGIRGAKQICQRLAVSTFPVYRCSYPAYCDEDTQPDDLSDTELEGVLASAPRAGGKKYGMGKRMAKQSPRRQKVFQKRRQ